MTCGQWEPCDASTGEERAADGVVYAFSGWSPSRVAVWRVRSGGIERVVPVVALSSDDMDQAKQDGFERIRAFVR